MFELEALHKITYGLYIVSSGDRISGNGFISNTVFQVTSDPPRFAVVCNKDNYTSGIISKSGAFSVSVLDRDTPPEIFGQFGFKSGKDYDKLKGMEVIYGETGVPIILNECIAYLECRLIQTVDAGTHLIFIGEMIQSKVVNDSKEPISYAFYRKERKGVAPKNAPTFIDRAKLLEFSGKSIQKKYQCGACGYIYDEAAEKIRFSDLPPDWICPVCGSEKSDFFEITN
jgi:flavin reductase (DIM6/NTAB) family NADH-FMN oxidoreductase RutF/rubredoxin